MQKLLFISIIISVSIPARPQLTGIGLPAPQAQLHVRGTNASQPVLQVQNFDNKNLLAANNGGTVTIGNITPAATLTIDGEPGSQHLFIRNTSGFGASYLHFRNLPTGSFRWQVSAFTFGINASSEMIMDHSEFPNLLLLRGDGRVGINNLAPAARLHVNGNLRFNNALLANGSAGNTGDVLMLNSSNQSQWVSAGKYYFDNTQPFSINGGVYVENNPSLNQATLTSIPFTFTGGPATLEYSFGNAVKGSCCATSYGYIEVFYVPLIGGGSPTVNSKQQFHFNVEDNRVRSLNGSSFFTLPAGLPAGDYVLNCRLVWLSGPRIYHGSFYLPETTAADYFLTYKLMQ